MLSVMIGVPRTSLASFLQIYIPALDLVTFNLFPLQNKALINLKSTLELYTVSMETFIQFFDPFT